MTETNTQENASEKIPFETDHWYAIFAGWLIIPAITSLFGLLGSILMVTLVNPAELSGFDLVIYWADAISLPLLLIVFYTWFRRKRIFPKVIIVFFVFNAFVNLAYLISGNGIDLVNLAMSIVWIVYFIRSERVKQTFIK